MDNVFAAAALRSNNPSGWNTNAKKHDADEWDFEEF
jgi:hypothetical protein